MIVEHIRIVEMLRDKQANVEYITKSFEYKDIKYSIYFS